MTTLRYDLVKRVQRLPKPTNATAALQPLFEAISNSIHATQAKFGAKANEIGEININIEIDRSKGSVLITVEDNGIGLDKKNYDAFTTTDTANKITIGGKGVGRLLWLDCFEEIQVKSTYENLAELHTRSFTFQLANENQVKDYVESPAPSAKATGTFIRFSGLRNNEYREKFPGRPTYIIQHFISHFLPSMIGGNAPKIKLSAGDQFKEFPLAVNEVIKRKSAPIEIDSENYGKLTFILMECEKVASADLQGTHFVHFIAHDRTVRSQKIDGKLGFKFFGENADSVFHGCLFGDFLDKHVNQERTGFTFEESKIEEIINGFCMPEISLFLAAPLEEHRDQQRQILNKVAETYPSVAFGGVDELQSHVPLGELVDDALYGHLSRERFRRDKRQAEKIRAVLTRLKSGDIAEGSLVEALKHASEALESAEQRSLAEYILRRKVILEFLEVLLQKVKLSSSDSGYQREDILHSFICPMRVHTLDNGEKRIRPSSHDLWIIDERLTFAEYFSSDVPLSDLAQDEASSNRPDVLIFDYVHGLRQTDGTNKIIIVEFKRPGKRSYADNENPQHQVEKYVKELQSGALTDVRGRPIRLDVNTIFYCYIIADIVGRMDDWTYTWMRTADGRGRIYQPRHGFNGVIEVIGWDALLSDAEERNQAFFDRLGISGHSFFMDEA